MNIFPREIPCPLPNNKPFELEANSCRFTAGLASIETHGVLVLSWTPAVPL